MLRLGVGLPQGGLDSAFSRLTLSRNLKFRIASAETNCRTGKGRTSIMESQDECAQGVTNVIDSQEEGAR